MKNMQKTSGYQGDWLISIGIPRGRDGEQSWAPDKHGTIWWCSHQGNTNQSGPEGPSVGPETHPVLCAVESTPIPTDSERCPQGPVLGSPAHTCRLLPVTPLTESVQLMFGLSLSLSLHIFLGIPFLI